MRTKGRRKKREKKTGKKEQRSSYPEMYDKIRGWGGEYQFLTDFPHDFLVLQYLDYFQQNTQNEGIPQNSNPNFRGLF